MSDISDIQIHNVANVYQKTIKPKYQKTIWYFGLNTIKPKYQKTIK